MVTEAYLEQFRAAARAPEPAWLAAMRERGIAAFGAKGFPTRRDEDWRFNDLRPLSAKVYAPAESPSAAPADLSAFRVSPERRFLLLVNGFLAKGAENPPGVRLDPAGWFGEEEVGASGPEALSSFAALNAALFRDGFALAVEKGRKVEAPVEILHWMQPGDMPLAAHARNRIVAGAGSEVTVIETYAGKGDYWTNSVTDIRVEAGAVLRHVKLQSEDAGAVHLAANRVAIAANGRYECFVLSLGGRLSRHDLAVTLDGEGGFCGIGGAYLLRGQQEATIATMVDHVAPACETREVVKGVVEQRAHGIFQGKIRVSPQAQRTNASQTNKNLLLSTQAVVDTKPELEILADDVKCSHGATVGDLDETALFYLRSRGIEEYAARRMLIRAFAVDLLDGVHDAAARNHLDRHLTHWLDTESGVSC